MTAAWKPTERVLCVDHVYCGGVTCDQWPVCNYPLSQVSQVSWHHDMVTWTRRVYIISTHPCISQATGYQLELETNPREVWSCRPFIMRLQETSRRFVSSSYWEGAWTIAYCQHTVTVCLGHKIFDILFLKWDSSYLYGLHISSIITVLNFARRRQLQPLQTLPSKDHGRLVANSSRSSWIPGMSPNAKERFDLERRIVQLAGWVEVEIKKIIT